MRANIRKTRQWLVALFTFLPLGGLGWVLSSCKDHFDLDKLQNPSKLVVYCFPSGADTTYISVTNSVGVRKITDTRKLGPLATARVAYSVNGEQRTVHQTDGGTFFVVGAHHAGDRIAIGVEHDDYAAVSAVTTVPGDVPIVMKSVTPVTEFDSYWQEKRDFFQVQATFSDPAATTDYYAVRVCVQGMDYDGRLVEVWPEIVTIDEPLLAMSDIDEDFGFENEYYGGFYVFSDQDINGQDYTLHLDIPTNFSGSGGLSDNLRFRVVLYRITAEYYRFLKSVNDVENNEMARGGFAQLMPTYTNIHGGAGVLAAFREQSSEYLNITQHEDE